MLGAWTQRARYKLDHQSQRVSSGQDPELAATSAAPAGESGSFGKKSPRTPRGEGEADVPQRSSACVIL